MAQRAQQCQWHSLAEGKPPQDAWFVTARRQPAHDLRSGETVTYTVTRAHLPGSILTELDEVWMVIPTPPWLDTKAAAAHEDSKQSITPAYIGAEVQEAIKFHRVYCGCVYSEESPCQFFHGWWESATLHAAPHVKQLAYYCSEDFAAFLRLVAERRA